MSGYYIYVKNDLLDEKHIKKMRGNKNCGVIWMFLWLLDKMTIIDHEKGEGKVLGGKPIKYSEFKKDICVSRRTYNNWVKILREEGYIKTKRTHYGLIFTVFKAYKVFGKKCENKCTSSKNKGKRCATKRISDDASDAHLGNDRCTSNKTSTVDNTVDSSEKNLAPFNLEEYIEKCKNNKSKHIQLIGLYMDYRKPSLEKKIRNVDQAQALIKRHLRAAKQLQTWDDDQVSDAIFEVDKNNKDIDWTLDTVYKHLTK